ncbi:tRNA threonylcarbamoyl adenosine modification protein YeaZ [Roseinatronobacter thiooxidans]|uniref:tRNA threonylcarbamoyl adenosine modification protein YeaZ n=1 Tax=Roseinatronobacter thiooxidans TaxID=121821 RepID=A0A2W7Q8R1_9RHOB|nr:tRNA (adenosine(37)-N6)-threonylcarbamoyltransferase complex dimerization subunit type 1 TsaB [Roseinatronobacter thiooxidans]PZX44601.1 tRNA threonylcarbamoyl adenosine modification protein YeaZ [Roseinatronobacter thiooxidans]
MPSDPCILAFDTTAAHCAAALLSGGVVVAQAQEDMARGQAERLVPLLEEVLQAAGLGWRDLDALAVGVGPGNFTGIRIAVSAARGLALGLDIPAIGVTIFEARAEGLPRPLYVVEDARRGEVYVQVFGDGDEAPFLSDRTDLAFAADAALVGSGASAEGTGLPVLAPCYPLAEGIARVAARKFGTAQPRPAPLYIRSADAAPGADLPPKVLP